MGRVILHPSDASLVLILLGHHEQSAIRPNGYTAEQTIALIKKLKECAEERDGQDR